MTWLPDGLVKEARKGYTEAMASFSNNPSVANKYCWFCDNDRHDIEDCPEFGKSQAPPAERSGGGGERIRFGLPDSLKRRIYDSGYDDQYNFPDGNDWDTMAEDFNVSADRKSRAFGEMRRAYNNGRAKARYDDR